MNRILAVAALAVLAVGCAPRRVYLNRDAGTAVVLAPLNLSMNVDAPWKMWKYVEREVAARGYALVPHATVEKFYVDKGFTGDPGQIESFDSKELAKIFNADVVVWSNVAEWGKKTLGIYTSIEVKLTAEILDREGNSLWKGEGEYGSSSTAKSWKDALWDTVGAAATDPERFAPGAAANCFASLPWAGWDPEMPRDAPPPPVK
jgi:hypothetical protein